jgi:hypothetical protein
MLESPCASDILASVKKQNSIEKWYEVYSDDIDDIVSMYLDIVMDYENHVITYKPTLRQDLIEWLYHSSFNKDLKNKIWQ